MKITRDDLVPFATFLLLCWFVGMWLAAHADTVAVPNAAVTVYDATAPVLQPNAYCEVCEGAQWTDPGATAQDNLDGDLSLMIVTSGTVNTAMPGRYRVEYGVADACGNPSRAVRVVDVISGPEVTNQPVAMSKALGRPVGVWVKASGASPLRYQWYRDGRPIAGATRPTWVSVMSAEVVGEYTCAVSNRCGSVTTQAVRITIQEEKQP